MNPKNVIVEELVDCARCGRIHQNIMFKPFSIDCDGYTHYAECPFNGQPILLKCEVIQRKRQKDKTINEKSQ